MVRRLAAEGLGSLLLAATVIGSGHHGRAACCGNLAVALLANTGATVAVLAVLIALLGPHQWRAFQSCRFSGSRSAASAAVARRGGLPADAIRRLLLGAVLAHAMFELPLIQSSLHMRAGPAQWLAEAVATCGLLLVILGHRRPQDAPWMVAAGSARRIGSRHPLRLPIPPSPSPARYRIPFRAFDPSMFRVLLRPSLSG